MFCSLIKNIVCGFGFISHRNVFKYITLICLSMMSFEGYAGDGGGIIDVPNTSSTGKFNIKFVHYAPSNASYHIDVYHNGVKHSSISKTILKKYVDSFDPWSPGSYPYTVNEVGSWKFQYCTRDPGTGTRCNEGHSDTVVVSKPISKPVFNKPIPDEKTAAGGMYTLTWSNPSGATKIVLFEKVNSNGNYKEALVSELTGSNKKLATSFSPSSVKKKGYTYYYKLEACNNLKQCSGLTSPIGVKVRTNDHPELKFEEFPNGENYRPGDLLTLYAIASDYNGIDSVKFYHDNGTNSNGSNANQPDVEVLIGSGQTYKAPNEENVLEECETCYRINWKLPSSEIENIEVWAVAEDNLGAKTKIIAGGVVSVSENEQPTGWLTNPPSTVIEGDSVKFTASASDNDGSVEAVEFLVSGSSIGIDTSSPYEMLWNDFATGTFDVKVKVTDNEGLTKESSPITVEVIPRTPPEAPGLLTIDGVSGSTPDNITGDFILAWEPVADAYYELWKLEVGVNTSYVKDTSYSNTKIPGHSVFDLRSGKYRYKVFACNTLDCSNKSSPEVEVRVVKEKPNSPKGLMATPDSDAQLFTGGYKLNWNDYSPVIDGIRPDYYKLQEKVGGPESAGEWITVSQSNGVSNHHIDSQGLGTFSYQVIACNARGCSNPGEIISVTVLPPLINTALLSCDDSCIRLSGSAFDPALSLQLTAIHNPNIQEVISYEGLSIQTGSDIEVELKLSSDIYKALFNLGIRATIINPNGSRGGITIYGDRATEIIGEVQSAPALGSDGTVYVGAGNKLYALDSVTGNVKPAWPFSANGVIKATPRVDGLDGTIYVGSLDHILYAVTPDAIEKWRLKTEGEIVSSAVLDDERILYFGSMDGQLYAVNAINGGIRWTYPANGGVAETPVLAGNDILYFTTVESNQVHAISRLSQGPGKLVWESVDDTLLWGEIGDWSPTPSMKSDFLTVARLYRGLLQPPLALNRKVTTFWTYQFVSGLATEVDIARAFLESDTGKVNFPPTQSDEAFISALSDRIYPNQATLELNIGGLTYSRSMLLDMLAGGYSRAQIAALFTQSLDYAYSTNALLSYAFDYLYVQDYSWAVTLCDSGDAYTRDCDGDELPDWWEILFLGSTDYDANDDPDGDDVTVGEAFAQNQSPCAAGCYNGITDDPPLPAEAPIINTIDLRVSESMGSLAGEFKVTESGAATYSVPISIPVGTAEVTPRLSLNYSSQGGNGILGQGWNLGGLSAISRCRRTLGQDGEAGAISWDSDDRFCLDGQRLILVGSGKYGEPGSKYRTEVDGFAMITAYGGNQGNPSHFTVERKDGSISYYGRGNKSQQLADEFGILNWTISRYEDSAGNGIEFIYSRDNGHRIHEIHYAFGDATQPGARVSFEYEDRLDVISGYYSGAFLSTKKRMVAVNVLGGDSSLLRSYELEYLDSGYDYLSRLERIRECAGGQCLPDTVFRWRLPATKFLFNVFDRVQLSNQKDRVAMSPRPVDINGDGLADLIWQEPDWDDDGRIHDQYFKYLLADADGFGSERTVFKYGEDVDTPYRWEMIDYNVDGRADLVVYAREHGHWMLHQSRAVHTDFEWTLPLGSSPVRLPITDEDTRFIDINGDGLVDAVSSKGYRLLERDFSEDDKSANVYHFGDEKPWQISGLEAWEMSDPGWESTYVYLDPQVVGDFNGDGQVDLVLVDSKQLWRADSAEDFVPADRDLWYPGGGPKNAYLSNQHTRFYLAKVEGDKLVAERKLLDFIQGGFGNNSKKPDATPLTRHNELNKGLLSIDINSDGLVDLLTKNKGVYSYQINTGEGFKESVPLGDFGENTALNWFDYEGDGDLDLVWREHDGFNGQMLFRRWESHAQNFAKDDEVFQALRADQKGGQDIFVDMNGDGVTDYLEFHRDYLHVYHQQNSNVAQNMVDQITNGLGAQTTIQYGSTSSSAHFARLGVSKAVNTFCEDAAGDDATEEWCLSYKANSIDDFYESINGEWTGESTLGKNSPVFETIGTQFLVTRVESTAPAADDIPGAVDNAATSAVSYFYGRARMQASGRGYLGFEKIRTVDEQTGVATTTTYRQDFPYIGYPLSTEQRSREGMLLSEAENTWSLYGWQSSWPQTAKLKGTAALGSLQPYISESIEKIYEFKNEGKVQGQLLKTVTKENQQDEHGNAKRIYVNTESFNGDYFSTETINKYGNGQQVSFANPDHNFNSYAELGRLTATEVSHKRLEAGEHNQATRKSTFTYYESGSEAGLLRSEVVEPDNGNSGSLELRLTTNYEYDYFGNKVLVEKTADNEESRVQRWVYDNGRFIGREENSYGQTTISVLERNSFGQPTLVTDIAGVETYLAYDVFGRQTLEYKTTGAYQVSLFAPAGGQCPTSAAYQVVERAAGGGESITCFDSLVREVRKSTIGFDGGWNFVDTEYDNLSRIQHKSEPYQSGNANYWTTQYYNLAGQVIGSDLPGIDSSNGTAYDLTMQYDGYTTITTNPKGQVHKVTTNAIGETVRVEDNLGNVQEFKHDALGNQRFVINRGDGSRNIVMEMKYDLRGRKILMSDPDKGIWYYYHNAFGDLVRQTDAEDQVIINHYDRLGRLIERNDLDAKGNPVETTQWRYNNNIGVDEYGTPPAALREVESFNSGFIKLHGYDNFGRTSETITSFSEGDDHFEKNNYDQYGRVFQVFDAGGNGNWESSAIQYKYNQYGYLEQVVDAERVNLATAEQFYTVLKMDARGNVTEYKTGNGVTTEKTFDPATGRLTKQLAHVLGVQLIQDLTYFWDDLGNLEYREDRSGDKNLREDFTYDGLNRLERSQVSGRDALEIRYDDLGNITYKSDVGDYRYGSECTEGFGPHAVCETSDGVSYEYNENGSMTSDSSGRSLVYTTFDKPEEITKDGHKTEFLYGPERKRYLRKDTTKDGQVTETRYIGNVEKVTRGDDTETKRYLPGGALVTISSAGRQSHYMHKDHLGSLDVITDASGQIAVDAYGNEQQFSFDAWGQRRNALDWSALLNAELISFASQMTTRGFTGHEMLDQVGLVHMNGRIYDPRLAKFLQADPFVQEPKYSQSHNRYAYAWNNPLNATDPSGYFIQIIAMAVLIGAEITCLWTIGAVMAYAAFFDAVLQGASFHDALRSGLVAGVSAAAFAAIGQGLKANANFKGTFAADLNPTGFGVKVAAHALTGGVMAELGGGKFGHGFVSAGFTAAATSFNNPEFIKGAFTRVAIASIIGGTASKLSGGKFANGAITGAFSQALNGELSGKDNNDGKQSLFDYVEELVGPENAEAFRTEAPGEYMVWKRWASKIYGNWTETNINYQIKRFEMESMVVTQELIVEMTVDYGIGEAESYYEGNKVAVGTGALEGALAWFTRSLTRFTGISYGWTTWSAGGTIKNTATVYDKLNDLQNFKEPVWISVKPIKSTD
ncbi:PQQ-binding-like beta-propeller repeat protein [Microbulbifer sp. ZKSA004]|uniref:RHS repeat-associated core domain-containing protein n=1 Tax=Microbulbifer sp. ZKSA004 TaxID=3243389 RepID=UPI004039BBAA